MQTQQHQHHTSYVRIAHIIMTVARYIVLCVNIRTTLQQQRNCRHAPIRTGVHQGRLAILLVIAVS